MSTTSNDTTVDGSCLCGESKYKVTGNPIRRVICHCKSCKKSSGTMFATNSFYKESQFSFESSNANIKTYTDTSCDSGGSLHRSFCIECGTTLFTRPSNFPGIVVVSVGTLDDQYQDDDNDDNNNAAATAWDPEREYFCKRRAPWLKKIGPLAEQQFQQMS